MSKKIHYTRNVRYNGKDIAFYFENVYDNQINLINYAKSS